MPKLHWEIHDDPQLKERYFHCKHPGGPTLLVCPKPGYSGAYALFSTKYGSIDTAIVRGDSVTELPEGTAHFLEHKLFESEDLDAFARFSKTGASANAYTSFDVTAYEFSCAAQEGNFAENLEILLDFVRSPYFTEATVQKEQGIIGQEIRMCMDSPGRGVFFHLLKSLYPSHPVRIEIAGTEASIAEISAELLHACYRHFYNPHNMALAVAGNVTIEEVEAVADRLLQPCEGQPARRKSMADNNPPTEALVTKEMAVSVPLFLLGCKELRGTPRLSAKEAVLSSLVMEVLTGESSALYEQLLGEGLINAGFGSELLHGDDYACALFEGESKQPELAARRIKEALLQAAEEGLPADAFERARKSAYGRMVMECNDVETIAGRMTESYFGGEDFFARARALREATPEQANARLREMFREDYFALSIIKPIEEDKTV